MIELGFSEGVLALDFRTTLSWLDEPHLNEY